VRRRWDVVVVISVGGALGSLARWAVAEAIPHPPDGFAWSTLVENVSGALLLGALMVLVLEVWPTTRYVRPFFGVGVLGGYTTFSTFAQEDFSLLESHDVGVALAYTAGSVLLGILAVYAGTLLGRSL
jgi:CrcB protein